nr:hypothetical protein [Tanacetum cinerariifolium]
MLPIELASEDIRNTKAYKEYYACATGEAAPKPNASVRRKRGGSASSTTPPTPIATPTPITTVVAATRLTTAAKGKQPARATSPTDPSDVKRTKAEQLKIVLRRSRQETHISQQDGFSTDKGTGSKPRVPDRPSDDSDEEISWNSSDDEDVDAQGKDRDDDEGKKNDESDDGQDDDDDDNDDEEVIAKIDEPKDAESESEDDGNGKEDQGLRISKEERMHEEEETDELYCDIDINQGKGLQVSQDIEDSHVTLTLVHSDGQQENRLQDCLQRENDEYLRTIDDNMKKIIKEQVKSQVKAQVTRIFPRIEESVNAQLEAEVLTRSSHSSRTSYAVAADLSEMELKKILIDKMEGNKSIQQSDEQRNLYKALVEAYDADKTIMDSYGESAILKRRREDDDDQEGPSAGLDRGSKRRREGGEHASASTPSEPATISAGRSTTRTQSRQLSASAEDQPIFQTSQHPEWFSLPRKPPTPDCDWNKDLPATQGNAQSWISALAKQTDARSSFNEHLDTPIDFSNFIMNRLGIDTLTPELLAGPT